MVLQTNSSIHRELKKTCHEFQVLTLFTYNLILNETNEDRK